MQQRIETIAGGTQHSHASRASAFASKTDAPERPLCRSQIVRATLNER
jgi:hypothetical protein